MGILDGILALFSNGYATTHQFIPNKLLFFAVDPSTCRI
jgi:hypothetical protein